MRVVMAVHEARDRKTVASIDDRKIIHPLSGLRRFNRQRRSDGGNDAVLDQDVRRSGFVVAGLEPQHARPPDQQSSHIHSVAGLS